MLINAINWCFILLSGYLLGLAFSETVGARLNARINCFDGYLAAGTVILISYSQFFSLFSGVGNGATLLLILVCILIVVLFRVKLWERLCAFPAALQGISFLKLFIGAFIVCFFLKISALQPTAYDDYLYHAQALQWVERYGLVKGLANLHNRFAYNSAFLCLQALFSWRGILPLSLHTVNSFYGCLLSLYCFFTLSFLNKRTPQSAYLPTPPPEKSDFLRLSGLFYILLNTDAFIGLDTDPLAMLCLCYVFIKWAELEERGIKEPAFYGFLSLLAACTVTLKLSCGPIVLFTLVPLILYLKKKEWKTIAFFAGLELLVVLPFLLRNALVSGYLIYPVALTALPVSWRMPLDSLLGDAEGIRLFGRGLNNLFGEKEWQELAGWSFYEWFPAWLRFLPAAYRVVFFLTVAAILLFLICILIKKLYAKQSVPFPITYVVSVCCFLFWLLSSPLIRYGGLFMFIVLAECFSIVYKPLRYCVMGASLLIMIFLSVTVRMPGEGDTFSLRMLVIPRNYRVENELASEVAPIQDENGEPVTIWYRADDGDQTDYAHFPSVPDHDAIVSMGYRGATIKDGFYFIP